MRRGGMINQGLRGGNMGYTPIGNVPRGGMNQMGGYQEPYYNEVPMNMNVGMGMPMNNAGGRRRGGIQAKMRQSN